MATNPARPATRLGRQVLRTCRTPPATATPSPLPRPTALAQSSPFSPHITHNPLNRIWHVNEDPERLDYGLMGFLGPGGPRLLPEELKWLAVTHKSFDQGRRGFNDRLAYLGRQVAIHECVQDILTRPPSFAALGLDDPFEGRREPFESPALRTVDNLVKDHPSDLISPWLLHRLAVDTGLSEVVRWKPRKTSDMKSSGMHTVMSTTVFAIVGAIALQQGGPVAGQIVRNRVISKTRVMRASSEKP